MKASHKYAEQRWQVISYLQPRLMAERELVQTEYKPRMQKVITELGGAIGERVIARPDGRSVTVRVVNFPDGSFARAPRNRDLEMEREFQSRPLGNRTK